MSLWAPGSLYACTSPSSHSWQHMAELIPDVHIKVPRRAPTSPQHDPQNMSGACCRLTSPDSPFSWGPAHGAALSAPAPSPQGRAAGLEALPCSRAAPAQRRTAAACPCGGAGAGGGARRQLPAAGSAGQRRRKRRKSLAAAAVPSRTAQPWHRGARCGLRLTAAGSCDGWHCQSTVEAPLLLGYAPEAQLPAHSTLQEPREPCCEGR